MRLIFYAFCTVLFLSVRLEAQEPDSLQQRNDRFIEEVATLLNDTRNEQAKTTAEQLEANYQAGALNDRLLQAMKGNFNLMKERRMKSFPQIENYFRAVNLALENSLGNRLLTEWNITVRALLENTKKGNNSSFQRFMDFSLAYFRQNALNVSPSKTWIAEGGNIQIGFEDGRPAVHMANIDLLTTSRHDTIYLLSTSGTYYPTELTWKGRGGKITWQNAGLDPGKVYCTLSDYTVDTRKGEFTADSVAFVYKPLIREPVLGSVVQKVMVNKTKGDPRYPDFHSYDKVITIDNLIENVSYRGGFRLRGPNIIGTGDREHKAQLTFLDKQGHPLARARAQTFNINPQTKAASSEAEISLYFDQDSIYHPGINMRYDIPARELVLTMGKQGISRSRFWDSYHKVEMDVERLVWKLDEQKIVMGMLGGGGQKTAYFESSDLFDLDLFNKYQGVLSYNPLVVMKNYCLRYDTRKIYAPDLAREFDKNLTVDQIRRILYMLMEDGFIYYDQETETVTVKDKVFKYVAAAYSNEDYDVIKLGSITTKDNAELDLKEKTLTIDGVDHFNLSNKNFVQIVPREQSVTMKEGRDMDFDGTVFAGRLDFSGENYQLDYDTYTIRLDRLVNMRINVPTDKLDEFGNPVLQPIKTIFEDLQGILYIDDPNNKAGRGKTGEYPKFENLKPSFIYYDKNCFYKDVYPRETFYFKVDPFVLDSLENFDVFSQAFAGELTSGFLPPFRENLIVEPDLSLGFRHTTPETGYPVYNGLGHYTGKLEMDWKGLHGNGLLSHLNMDIHSEDFLFFPDSVRGFADRFIMAEKEINEVNFPSVTSESADILWKPNADSLLANMRDERFNFFNGIGTLKGSIVATSRGVTGSGTFDWKDARIVANDFTFGMKSLMADTANLTIKSLDKDKIAFNLPNVRANVDFDQQKGVFRSNLEDIATVLPYNQYETTMNSFEWDIARGMLHFNPPENRRYARFTSLHPGQDSLSFLASKGSYNLNDYTLIAKGVPGIDIADARITPGDKIVLIGADAQIKPIDSATIIIDTLHRYHTFYNAKVDILGKYSYRASGDYPYRGRDGLSEYLHFADIGVKTVEDSAKTWGRAAVLESDSFLLDPEIRFQGNAELLPGEPLLQFSGIARFTLPDSSAVRSDWFWVDQTLDPENVGIIPSKKINLRGDSTYAAIFYRTDTTLLYTCLMAPKIYRRDVAAFRVDGMVRYNADAGAYEVADSLLARGENSNGNVLQFGKTDSMIHASGKTRLGLDVQMVKLQMAGDIIKRPADTTYTFTTDIALGFHLTKEVWQVMIDDWLTLAFDAPDIDYTDQKVSTRFEKFFDSEKDLEKFRTSLLMTGEPTLPDDLPQSLILTDVKLVWDPMYASWRSVGKIGLSHVNGTKIGKYLTGYVEFGRRTDGDFFNIYLETELHDWYFITYKANLLQILSSNVHLNDIVMDTKVKDRRIVGKDKFNDYLVFSICNPGKKELFVSRMKYYETLRKKQKH